MSYEKLFLGTVFLRLSVFYKIESNADEVKNSFGDADTDAVIIFCCWRCQFITLTRTSLSIGMTKTIKPFADSMLLKNI